MRSPLGSSPLSRACVLAILLGACDEASAPVDASAAGDGALGDLVGDAAQAADGGTAALLPQVPNLVVCTPQPAADAFVHKSESSPSTTRYQACVARCADWTQCTVESVARGRAQLELFYVVDEDGNGNGFGGTLRFTKQGARDRMVLFHKGGAGTEYVDDFLPQKVEDAGGTAIEPRWLEETDTKVGWFSRPFGGSTLQKNLYGVSARPAAIMKWIFQNLATAPISTVGCSGGSIATYYPRHWHGLDAVLRYQLLSGGPVMSKIQSGCGGRDQGKGRCTMSPTIECTDTAGCGAGGGTCSPYAWKRPDLIMSAVRGTIDHLHAGATNGGDECAKGDPQPAFDASDFDSPSHPIDAHNEHPIDFMMNVADANADDVLNVLASGAAVYAGLTGAKTWTTQTTGIHCDTFKTEAAWQLLKTGAGL